MPISAMDTISLAFEHAKRQLFQPFRFWQWTRLAIVGLLAGELGSGGNFHIPSSYHPAQHGGSQNPLGLGFPKVDPALLFGLIGTIVITGLIIAIVMLYISSVMRFILFDSVLRKECHIRQGWVARQGPGLNYFFWQLGFMFVTLGSTVILLGVPLAIAFSAGWLTHPGDHVLPLVLEGIVTFALLIIFLIALASVNVLTKDFVIPQMALEGVGAIEGWRRLWPMLEAEKNDYAIYIVMKIVLAIGAAIAVGIVSVIMGLLFAVPVIGVAIAAVIGGKTAGWTWNAMTITAAVVAALILFAIFMSLISLVSVPVIVFFPAYSIYFFAARYRPLSLALYSSTESAASNPLPPDLPPAPAPA
jgi:hypothetical protein